MFTGKASKLILLVSLALNIMFGAQLFQTRKVNTVALEAAMASLGDADTILSQILSSPDEADSSQFVAPLVRVDRAQALIRAMSGEDSSMRQLAVSLDDAVTKLLFFATKSEPITVPDKQTLHELLVIVRSTQESLAKIR